ncbi:MAG: hypothetical protein R2820_14740 [Cyclobacteriaceae bacterium]|nr:hypothetical protein [Cyclobacteriaceae bacterium]
MLKQIATLFFAGLCFTAIAQSQTSDDEYTRYELLEPSTQSFRILYEVTATKPGMLYYFNTLRKGSEHKIDTVWDLRTGQPLKWSVVGGAQAKKDGLQEASADDEYLKVQLAHAIANNSEYRLLIDKTYKDAKSYFTKDNAIVFERSLGIKRNSVVLPRGYELTSCNYPVQVSMESDGRIKASFINSAPVAVPLRIEARKLPTTVDLKVEKREYTYTSGEGRDKSKARVNYQVPERAHQTREIVYFLQQPETHSFRLYHDYTESRVGKNNYLNVVRAGSKASNPSAMNLDTGQPLKVETIKGSQVKEKGIVMEEEITPETEIIVIWYDAVKKGESTRIRIEETYTDPNRYVVNGNELVWDRAFGRPHNTVILPAGWFLTDNAIPATISTTQDGKISLYYMNYDPDEIDVFIKARKR